MNCAVAENTDSVIIYLGLVTEAEGYEFGNYTLYHTEVLCLTALTWFVYRG